MVSEVVVLGEASAAWSAVGVVIAGGLLVIIPVFARRSWKLRVPGNRYWVIGSLIANCITFVAAIIQILSIICWSSRSTEWNTTVISTSILAALLLQNGARGRSHRPAAASASSHGERVRCKRPSDGS